MEITEEILDVLALEISQEYEKNESNAPTNIKELISYNFISCRLEGSLGVIDFLKGILRDDEEMIEILKDYLKEN